MDTKNTEIEEIEQPRKALIPDVQIIPCTPEVIKSPKRASFSEEDKLRPTTPEMLECLKLSVSNNSNLTEWNLLSTPPKPQSLLDYEEHLKLID